MLISLSFPYSSKFLTMISSLFLFFVVVVCSSQIRLVSGSLQKRVWVLLLRDQRSHFWFLCSGWCHGLLCCGHIWFRILCRIHRKSSVWRLVRYCIWHKGCLATCLYSVLSQKRNWGRLWTMLLFLFGGWLYIYQPVWVQMWLCSMFPLLLRCLSCGVTAWLFIRLLGVCLYTILLLWWALCQVGCCIF